MRRSSVIAHLAFIAMAAIASASFADDRTVEPTRINLGRGQFVIVQLPVAPQVAASSYALTGEVIAQPVQPHVRLGIRGQTVFVP